LWAALRSTNPRVFPCAVRVLKCLVSDGRTCVALTASANSPNGCPPPSSFSSLMQMGGAEPLAAALKHLAQQKQMQRRYQQQLKQIGMATYEMAREAPDLIEALENAWASASTRTAGVGMCLRSGWKAVMSRNSRRQIAASLVGRASCLKRTCHYC
ncbi:hypothetical protein DUNSADRAFT_13440, partial [Dunaliella salina]